MTFTDEVYGVAGSQMVFSYSNQPEIARSVAGRRFAEGWLSFTTLEEAKRAQATFSNPDMHPIVKVIASYEIKEIG